MSTAKRYFDPVQAESDHKDLIISQLKSELYELKANQQDFNYLNNQLNNLQHKYTLLQEEKLKGERERRQRIEQDQKSVIGYKEECDLLQSDLRNQNIDLQECISDNNALKDMTDLRGQEIAKLQAQLSQVEIDNTKLLEENEILNGQVSDLKLEKKNMIADSEKTTAEADSLVSKTRNLEKGVQNLRIDNSRAEKQLIELEQQADKLNFISKERSQNINEEEYQLREQERVLKDLESEIIHAEKLNEKYSQEQQTVQNNYNSEVVRGKEFATQLQNIETTIRSKELHIDDLRNNFEVLKSKNYQLKDEQKSQNVQIDVLLQQIEELNIKNKELNYQVEQFQEQDERVRMLLDRKGQSQDLITRLNSQLKDTNSNILHLTRQDVVGQE